MLDLISMRQWYVPIWCAAKLVLQRQHQIWAYHLNCKCDCRQ